MGCGLEGVIEGRSFGVKVVVSEVLEQLAVLVTVTK